jgi:hypothetical protein
MLKSLRLLFLLFSLLPFVLGLGGCSGTPTRHLASDVAMIKAGDTSRDEVLKLMGEPDAKRMLTPDTEEWAYYEESRSALQETPFMGDAFDPNGYTMVLITFTGNIVETCNYRGYDEGEFDWQDDYSWQEIKK